MGSKAALRKRRRAIRAEALAIILTLGDAELKNMKHELGRQMEVAATQMSELRLRLDAVKSEMERRRTGTPVGIHISDHALVRYMERVKGIDMVAMRTELAEIAVRAKKERAGRHGCRSDASTGLTLGVDENTTHVTTVFMERELPILEVA